MNRAARGTFWLIAKYENRRLAVLTIDRGAGETLPVFSYEEEANAYLWFASLGMGWRARKTTAGELVSVLYGPCAGAKKAALDPLPVGDGAMVDLVSLPRKRFVRILVSERQPSAPRQSLFRVGAPSGSDTSDSSGEKGAWVRENGEQREHTEDGAGAPPEPRRLFYLRRGSYEAPRELDEVTIPDYVMMDFGSRDGSHDAHDGRLRAPQASKVVGEEDLGQDRE